MGYEKTSGGVFVPVEGFGGKGVYHCQHIRHGEVIDEWDAPNLTTYQGLDALLGIMFTSVTQITSWYLGVFSGNYTPVAGDTAATFPASATESSAYTSGTRPVFTAVEATRNVTNAASVATFTFNAGVSVYGGFLSSSSTKGGTGGILFSAAQFTGAPKVMANLDQMLMTYSYDASSI